jgi:MFS family permease
MIPVYAKDIFHGTAATFGVIDSIIGLGAFTGAIYLASLKPDRDLRMILAINTVIFGIGLMSFSHAAWYSLALCFAAVSGFGMMSQVTISNTLIQTTVSPEMRGRVISFYATVFFGLQPIGGLIIGSLSQWVGTTNIVLAEGVVALVAGVVMFRSLHRKQIKNEEIISNTNSI